MLPEERAREKIDRQLKKAGWEIVSREEYIPHSASAVKEGLMQGNTESDYLLFVDDKAIAVVEAKREENPLAEDVQSQAEGYATHPQSWYVKPLEVVLFMKDVMSDVLYTQMKGRGCRVMDDEKLREVTPNAGTKECYYIVDAVGVTEHEKVIPHPIVNPKPGQKVLSLEHLLEHIAHNELSDENLWLLRDYCATIHRRYEDNPLFGRHLDAFIANYGFAPRTIANVIQQAFDQGSLPSYVSPSEDNSIRMALIECLITSIPARRKLLEMQRGYVVRTEEDPDELIYAGFSKETARSFIENFEKYLNENKDRLEALRIIYNAEDTVITHTMLAELRDSLLAQDRRFGIYPGQPEPDPVRLL